MRIAKTGIYGGDSSPVVGRWLLTIIAFFVSLFLGIVILGPFGIIAAFIVAFFVWRFVMKNFFQLFLIFYFPFQGKSDATPINTGIDDISSKAFHA